MSLEFFVQKRPAAAVPKSLRAGLVFFGLFATAACSSDGSPSNSPGSGGSTAVDGTGSTGGAESGTGGVPGSGGADATTGGTSSGGSPSTDQAPTKQQYLTVLRRLVDALVVTQNDAGALVSPSTNPDPNPIHSRAGEAVYPFAVLYKHTQEDKYKTAAVRLGNWLISVQESGGFWSEDWPAAGWNGTTADQLISLAGAYSILKAELSEQERTSWDASVTRAADWIEAEFPMGNINYQPTGAVALVLAHQAVDSPKAAWLTKAKSLMDSDTLSAINADTLLTGEGNGVDLGYNIAQSIGFIAMYGLATDDRTYVETASKLLKTHYHFMYPNGAIDNSWGTRSYKWMLESGTKTAPGIYFTFGLLADQDPTIQRGAQLALKFLEDRFLDEDGWVVYGPHAFKHPSSDPPSNYSTFARAQSIATVLEFGPEASEMAPIPGQMNNWFRYYSSVKTGVGRSEKIMATVTAYKTGRYASSMVGGGSASAVWFEGYGATGFLQVSSQTDYTRVEPRHMPTESDLLPLTPRIETRTGSYHTNLYDSQATVSFSEMDAGFAATSTGVLRTSSAGSSGVSFTWKHEFGSASYSKEVAVSAAESVQIVEPFVDNPGNQYSLEGDTFRITTSDGGVWQLSVESSSGGHELSHGTDRSRYWAPFPGIECYPVIIRLSGTGNATVRYTVSQVSP